MTQHRLDIHPTPHRRGLAAMSHLAPGTEVAASIVCVRGRGVQVGGALQAPGVRLDAMKTTFTTDLARPTT